MKKDYSKPLLFAESFELLEHVAGNCNGGTGAATNARAATDCGMTDGSGFTLFANASKCTSQYIAESDVLALGFDGYADYIGSLSLKCYTVFNNVTNDYLFSS